MFSYDCWKVTIMKIFLTRKFGDKEYIVCLPLLWLVSFVLLSLVVFGFYQNDWSLSPNYYKYCSDPIGCNNDFFNSVSCLGSVYEYTPICTQKFIPYQAHIGDKPSWIIENINWISIVSIALFLILNTFLFNKKILKDIKVE